MKLEHISQDNSGFPTTVVLDYRVHLFGIIHNFKKRAVKPKNLETWVASQWCCLLNYPYPKLRHRNPNGYNTIIVDDEKVGDKTSGTYWRHNFAEVRGMPHYKGNRPPKPSEYSELHHYSNTYVHGLKDFLKVSEPGFEADDLAGEVHRIINKLSDEGAYGYSRDGLGRKTFYWTVDGDWQQLINDSSGQLFAGTLQGLMSEYEIKKAYYSKGHILRDLLDIPQLKAKIGDRGDNLPPGCPLGLVDLLNPPHVPTLETHQKLLDAVTSIRRNDNETKYIGASQWLMKNQ